MDIVQGGAVLAAGVAAATDIVSKRIPNWLTLGLLLVGVLLNFWLHGVEGAVGAVAGAALCIGLLLPFYAMGVVGAGDAKLLGGLGALVGPQALLSVSVYGALPGGVMSVIILLRNGRLSGALSDLLVRRQLPARGGATAPYAVAIASGVVLSVTLPLPTGF